MGNGKLDPEAVKIYQAMGDWLKVKGESIYNTRRNPLVAPPEWGNVSVSKDGKSLYLHVFKWAEGELSLEGVSPKVTTTTLLDGAPQFLSPKKKESFSSPSQQRHHMSLIP